MRSSSLFHTFWIACLSYLALGLSVQASPSITPPTPSVEEAAYQMRQKLTPFLFQKLQDHCGEDCPSFQIDPQYKIPLKENSIDHLGFHSLQEETLGTPELQSVQVLLLIDKTVKKKAQDTLQRIVTSSLSNVVAVPVRVEMKLLPSSSPLSEKRAFEKQREEAEERKQALLSLLKRLIWPTTLFLGGVLLLLGMMLFLKNKRALLQATLDAEAAKMAAEKEEREAAAAAAAKKEEESRIDAHLIEKGLAKLLEHRREDLKWFVEDRTHHQDAVALKRLLTLFPAPQLTSQLNFAPSVFRFLASFTDQPELNPGSETLDWLKHQMERAHWKRLEEQKRPLALIARLSKIELVQVFKKLGSVGDRALLLLSIAEEQWADCLSALATEERIQLGMAIAQYHHLTPVQRQEVEQGLAERIRGAEESMTLHSVSEDLEKFSLYLPEPESQRLWKSLSSQYASLPASPASKSLDDVFQDMSLKEALEVFTRLSLHSLSILLERTTEANRKRIHSSLPKALQERLKARLTQGLNAQESDIMKARAEFWVEYRKFKKILGKTA